MFNIYATDYAPVDPITPPCDIVPIFIGYKGENKARCLVFDLTECVSTFGDGGFVISFIRQGDELPYLVTNTDRLDNNAIWIINSTDTAVDGYGMVQLQYIVDDVICKSALYRTVTFDSNGITGDVPDPYEDLLAQIAAYAATAEGAATTATAAANTATTAVENGIVTERSQRIAADNGLQQQITNLMGLAGAPVMANTAAAMTDSSKIYVYTGSEAGYTFGNWYYFNGAEWVSGGVYQASAVETDPTLSVEGMAADAAATGDLKSQIYSAFVTETASGSIASFDDGADNVPVKSLVVNITPKQSGTGDPSPTNIRAISGFTEANIIRSGKNMAGGFRTGYTVNTTTGEVTVAGNYDWISNKIKVGGKPFALTVVDKGNMTNGSINIARYKADGSFYNWTNIGYFTSTIPFTRLYNAEVVDSIIIFGYQSGGASAITTAQFQVEFGTAATEYEPYNGDTYNVSFGSAGTVYGGTLDVTSGMLTVTRKNVDMGSLNWEYNTGGVYFTVPLTDCIDKTPDLMTSIGYIPKTYWSAFSSGEDMSIFKDTNGRLYLKNAAYTDAATFKTAMTGIQLVYPIKNPISVQLTATEVRTLLGNNNIWSDTGSVASLDYRADTKLYLEKLTNPDSDMVADANITSGQYFMSGNTLYLATANIANGASIIPGTNCTATNLAAALNAINA